MNTLPRLLAVPEAAVIKPLAQITATASEVLLPGQLMVADLVDRVLDTGSNPVTPPPPPPQALDLWFFEQELIHAIETWEIAAIGAVLDAVEVIEPLSSKEIDYVALIASVASVGGALILPLAPWVAAVGAAASVTSIAYTFINPEKKKTFKIEDIEETLRGFVDAVARDFNERIHDLATNMLRKSQASGFTKQQAHREVITWVFGEDVIRTASRGNAAINQTALRDKIGFNMLLDFAELGIESDEYLVTSEPLPGGGFSGPTGSLPIPHVRWVESYSVKPTKTQHQDGSQTLNLPGNWIYQLKETSLQVVGLPKYKTQLKKHGEEDR